MLLPAQQTLCSRSWCYINGTTMNMFYQWLLFEVLRESGELAVTQNKTRVLVASALTMDGTGCLSHTISRFPATTGCSIFLYVVGSLIPRSCPGFEHFLYVLPFNIKHILCCSTSVLHCTKLHSCVDLLCWPLVCWPLVFFLEHVLLCLFRRARCGWRIRTRNTNWWKSTSLTWGTSTIIKLFRLVPKFSPFLPPRHEHLWPRSQALSFPPTAPSVVHRCVF